MKTFSVAVAVAIVLAFICTQESSALPVTGVEELVELVSSDDPVADHQELPVELGERLFNIRKKRAPAKCTPYCYPTRDGVFCGVRCDFQ
uniref:HAMP1 n=1 Tax=Epinephelus coioides TaxID=94232 RepID=I6MGW1_EPICO|nr:HAMP1 [Epinephelus coioides]AEK87109.1 HAMP1 [Epinephelus coioides]